MDNLAKNWRVELKEEIVSRHPSYGQWGRDTLDGLVRAMLLDKMKIVPSASDHESMAAFVALLSDAREIADYMRGKYGKRKMVSYINKERSVS